MKPARLLLVIAAATAMGGCATLITDRPEDLDARHRLERGLSALDAGVYTSAFDDLAWVYTHCAGREAAGHALLALAALELDPRNDRARPAVGTDLLGRAITGPTAPGWVRPLAETSFLTALALGAPHPGEVDGAGHEGHEAHEEADGDPVTPPQAEPSRPAGPISGADLEDPADPAMTAEAALDAPAATAGPAYGCGRRVPTEDWLAPELPELPGPSMAALLSRAEARRDSLSTHAVSLEQELASLRAQLQATREELERIRTTLKP